MLRGWEVVVVTAPLGPDANEALGFPRIFTERARIVECGPASDVLEPIRRLLWLLGLRRNRSLTEQIKAQLPASGSRTAFERAFQTLIAIIGWPDLQAPWKRAAVRAAEALLTEQHFDGMVSSSPYPTSHLVAAILKDRHPSLRWVADFRDLWADNHSNQTPAWRQWIDRRWEHRILRCADALTSPTEKWAEQLARLHGKPGFCVPNGFVDYETEESTAPALSRKFELLYTGVRYPKQQSIRPLLEAIASLQAERFIDPSSFRFRWIGPFDSETSLMVSELGIASLVSQESSVGRREARKAQANAHAVLFLQWEDARTDWSSSLKLHEYVGCGRPILALGGHPESNVSALLRSTGRSVLAVTADEAATALRQWVGELRITGSIPVSEDWRSMARTLSGISRGMARLESLFDSVPSPGSL